MTDEKKGVFTKLWLVSFFHGMGPGFWIPALTNLLRAEGMGEWIAWAFAIPPICALVSPLIGGAMADERMQAQKLLGWCSFACSITLVIAFAALDFDLGVGWFLAGLTLYSIASGPTWGLVTTISLTHLSNGEKRYPLVRVAATFGWMVAGFFTSYAMNADVSPVSGYASALARIVTGVLAFMLPATPPLGQGRSWRSALGLGGFVLFKNRDHAAVLIITGCFSVPLAAFYMYSPELFKALGDETPTATMTVAQWSEIVAMFALGSLMLKYRLKTLLMWGMGLSALRFALSGYGGMTGVMAWHTTGVAMHGVCYTIYFITVQVYLNRRVKPELRGQAQGLLAVMAGGVGPLVGAFFCGWLRDTVVDESGRGWDVFWWVLSSMIVVCWLLFGCIYRGLGVRK
ncbi:MFS transporter [Luteolibacter algae]|uniref:MFS transporter n=1 Tax=Luteolibacter algae TaxID=454151 RepID=A0ABW5D505_9BACT